MARFRRLRHALLVSALLVGPPGLFAPNLAGQAKAADDTAAPCSETSEACALRSTYRMPDNFKIALAKYGKPLWHTVSVREGEGYESILAKVCGEQTPAVYDFLKSEFRRLNFTKLKPRQLDHNEVVAVPFCLKEVKDRTVIVQENDIPGTILLRENGLSQGEALTDFYEHNKSKFESFEDFEKGIQPGDELIVPFEAQQRVFVPASAAASTTTFKWVFDELPDAGSLKYVMDTSNEAPPEQREPQPELRFVNKVSFSSASAEESEGCRANDDPFTLANVNELKRRLALELGDRRKFTGGLPAAPVVLGIVDSGLNEVGDDYFDARFFDRNDKEYNEARKPDDDGNGFDNDVYGIDMDRGGDLYPRSQKYRSHGTEMAALALGGPTLFPQWTEGMRTPPILLRIVNFSKSSATSRNGAASPSDLVVAIEHLAADRKAGVINLSLVAEANISVIRKAIESSQDQALMVVAAGNAEQGNGKSIDLPRLYPASMEMVQSASNILTVGAHDNRGGTASFSNRSKSYVALLAPGCAVPSRDHEQNPVRVNGTSPATAITSFAAALVTHVGRGMTPLDVRNRLIVATDYDPSLKEVAFSSGRLNIVKAISLFHDVIDYTDGKTGPRFAKGIGAKSLTAICIDPPGDNDNLPVKVIPNQMADGKLTAILWFDVDGAITPISCDQKTEGVDLGQWMVEGRLVDAPPIENIKEIVLASYRVD